MPTAIPAAAAADIQRPLTLSQYAALLNITIETARNWCKKGRVPGAVQMTERGDWRIPLAAVPPSLQPNPVPTETLRQRRKRGERAMKELLAMK